MAATKSRQRCGSSAKRGSGADDAACGQNTKRSAARTGASAWALVVASQASSEAVSKRGGAGFAAEAHDWTEPSLDLDGPAPVTQADGVPARPRAPVDGPQGEAHEVLRNGSHPGAAHRGADPTTHRQGGGEV